MQLVINVLTLNPDSSYFLQTRLTIYIVKLISVEAFSVHLPAPPFISAIYPSALAHDLIKYLKLFFIRYYNCSKMSYHYIVLLVAFNASAVAVRKPIMCSTHTLVESNYWPQMVKCYGNVFFCTVAHLIVLLLT